MKNSGPGADNQNMIGSPTVNVLRRMIGLALSHAFAPPAPTGGQLAAIHVYGSKACGHKRHVGSCSICQREQLSRWSSQLEQVSAAVHHPQAA
jgi:hypothetical protein